MKSPALATRTKSPLSWRQRLLLIAFGLALVGLAELVLRASGLAPPARPRDPLLHGGVGERSYELSQLPGGEPAYICRWIRPGYDFNFQPIPLHKAVNETRLFVFGGSSAVGYPYDGRLAFSRFLEVGLAAALPDRLVRVINVAQNAIPTGTCLRIMREMADYAPDIFIVYSGDNEYANDHIYRSVRRASELAGRLRKTAGHLALYRGLERLILPAKMRFYASFVVSDEGVQPPAYSAEERRLIADNYAYVIQAMADFCAERRIRLVLCTCAVNAADWPPYRSTFSTSTTPAQAESWLQEFATAWQAFQEGDYDNALTRLETLAKIDDTRADLHYLMGRTLAAKQRFAEAWGAFERAVDLDNVCYRARPSHNQLIRQVAERAAVPLVDTVALLRAKSPNGLLGENFFWDHCHPRPDAHAAYALALARTLFAAGWLPRPGADWEDRFSQAVAAWRQSVAESADFQARAYRNVASGWMGLWTSHRQPDDLLRHDSTYLDRALEYLEKALQAHPKCPGAYFYRGVIYAQRGDLAHARSDWERELALQSEDGPMKPVLAGLLSGEIPPDRGFESWLFIRNEMLRY